MKLQHDGDCWTWVFGPICVINGTALSVWLWKILITWDKFDKRLSVDWNPS